MKKHGEKIALEDQRSLKFSNSKSSQNEHNFTELNDWVKDKLNEDQSITITRVLLKIDNNFKHKSSNAFRNICSHFMDDYKYSFRIPQEILMSNNQLIPQIEAFKKQFEELIESVKW